MQGSYVVRATSTTVSGSVRVGQYFAKGIPNAAKVCSVHHTVQSTLPRTQAFTGEIMHVRLWEGVRGAEEISKCMQHISGPYHSRLLGAWPLQGSLRDEVCPLCVTSSVGPLHALSLTILPLQSGRLNHMNVSVQSLWDEVEDMSWEGALWTRQITEDVAWTLRVCADVCAADPSCSLWMWDSSGCFVSAAQQGVSLVASPGATVGRYKHCAGLTWEETRRSALYALSYPLPEYSSDPDWWYFNVTLTKEACAAACSTQVGCTAWTWTEAAATCHGVQTPTWKPAFEDGVISGTAMSCERFPSLSFVPVGGGRLKNAEHARALCAKRKQNVVSVQGAQHVNWLAQATRVLTYYNSIEGTVPIAQQSGATLSTFDGEDVTALLSSMPSRWNVWVSPSDAYVGLPLAAENETLMSWPLNSTLTTAVLCEGTTDLQYAAHSLVVQETQVELCIGSPDQQCVSYCKNGHCSSLLGPCVCHSGYYPEGDCSKHCDGTVSGTSCLAPRPAYRAHPKAVVPTIGTHMLGLGTPHDDSVPMLHTTAVHLSNTKGAYRIKVVRAEGKSCTVAPHPASPAHATHFVGYTDTADGCAELVDLRVEYSTFMLWDVTDMSCRHTVGDVAEDGPHNTTVCNLPLATSPLCFIHSSSDACSGRKQQTTMPASVETTVRGVVSQSRSATLHSAECKRSCTTSPWRSLGDTWCATSLFRRSTRNSGCVQAAWMCDPGRAPNENCLFLL